eukprot:Skav223290  [mRNA]  locus=scaffold2998:116554:117621:+ [translate_table: standard]
MEELDSQGTSIQAKNDGDEIDDGEVVDEELILRIPLEVYVPSDLSLYNLKQVVSAKLAEADLEPRQDPMSMLLGLNGQVCGDPVACPLRMLVPGSVVSLVADLPEAHEVSRLGVCLNAFQLMQVQMSGFASQSFPAPGNMVTSPASSRPRQLLPDDVMQQRRKELYKTQLCTNFTGPNGLCSFGDRCHFAHGKGELRVMGQPGIMANAGANRAFSKRDEPAQSSKDTTWKWSEKWEWKWEGWNNSDNDRWKNDNSDWKRDRDWSWDSRKSWDWGPRDRDRQQSQDWDWEDWSRSPKPPKMQTRRSESSGRSASRNSLGGLVLRPGRGNRSPRHRNSRSHSRRRRSRSRGSRVRKR